MSGVIPLLPLYTFTVWTRTNLRFQVLFLHITYLCGQKIEFFKVLKATGTYSNQWTLTFGTEILHLNFSTFCM
jgi:hypothetical protein